MTTDGESPLSWPGNDDKVVIEEMLRDKQSTHWYECRELVKRLVQAQERTVSPADQEDIVQDAMIRIQKSLGTFQQDCRLRTWLFILVRNCVIDFHRKLTRLEASIILPGNTLEDSEQDEEIGRASTFLSTEDQCISQETLREALKALREWADSTNARAERNWKVIEMVIIEGHTLEEAARKVGCSPAVASYIVRTARSYVRRRSGGW